MRPLVAVVTGASRGLGREVSRQLLDKGYIVYLGVRGNRDPFEESATRYDGRARVRTLDVTSSEDSQRLCTEISAEHGGLDALVNNAAIHYDTWQTASRADMRVVQDALNTNVLGAWRMAVALAPLMGLKSHGVIVNVSSGAGALDSIGAHAPAYSVSKAALNALTISLAKDLSSRNILVNAVCPGWVATDMGGAGGRPVQDGAAGIVWAATLPHAGPTGGFFRDGKPISWVTG